MKRHLFIDEKRRTYGWKETYIWMQSDRSTLVGASLLSRRWSRSWMNTSKETYTWNKRNQHENAKTYINDNTPGYRLKRNKKLEHISWNNTRTHMEKKTYTYTKRDLHLWRKKPTSMEEQSTSSGASFARCCWLSSWVNKWKVNCMKDWETYIYTPRHLQIEGNKQGNKTLNMR